MEQCIQTKLASYKSGSLWGQRAKHSDTLSLTARQLGPGDVGSTAPEAVECASTASCSVRRFCNDFKARKLPLHLLVANAGVMSPATRHETEDGLEMQFQV
jgi:hypothetical protein